MLSSRLFRFLFGWLLGLTIAVLTSVNVLLLWVATGPRSLDKLSPYIEVALEQAGNGYDISIGQTWLIWDGWKHPVDIRLRNVSVTTKDGVKFSAFPEISLGLHIVSMLKGEILPTSLTFSKPIISLLQTEDNSICFGMQSPDNLNIKKDSTVIPFAALVSPLLTTDEKSTLRKLRSITIQDADLSVGSLAKGVFFNADNTNIKFSKSRSGTITTQLSATILYDQYNTPVHASFVLGKNLPTIEGAVSFRGLMPGVLFDLFSESAYLQSFQVPLTGEALVTMDQAGKVKRASFILDGGQGTVSSDKLTEPLSISSLRAEGQIHNDLQDIQIDKFTAGINGAWLSAQGVISVSGNDVSVRTTSTLENVPVEKAHLFWPPSLAPKTREWVTSNVTAGHIPKAEARINIGYGDLKLPALPKEAVDANIQLENASITYLPDHPQVEKISGIIHVDGIALDAQVTSAHYLQETKLSEGRVYIADLNPDNPYLEITLSADSTASDIIHFLNLPRLKKAEHLNLKQKEAKGSIKGKAKVGFNFYAPKDAQGNPLDPDIMFDVSSEMAAISQTGFMNKFDLQNTSGSLRINNQVLEFAGKGNVNGATVNDATVKYLFEPETNTDKRFDTFITVNANAPVEILPRFGYPIPPVLSGSLGIKAEVKQGPELEISDATIDLTNSSLQVEDIAWSKPAGAKASLKITAEKNAGALSIPSLQLTGDALDIQGTASLSKDFTAIEAVTLNRVQLGQTQLDRLSYKTIEGGHEIAFKGSVADVSPWLENGETPKKEPSFSFQHFPALQLKAEVGRLIVGKSRELQQVNADIDCSPSICNNATINAKTADGKDFSFRILRNPKGARQLSISAGNGGAVLEAFDFVGGVENGELTVTGNFDDSSSFSKLSAKVNMNKFTVRDAPVLAKLLSLASFTGMIDTLRGKGIYFEKLNAPFVLHKDVITMDNAKMYGPAMGLTAKGDITFPARRMDVEGTIVPSYTLNTVFGKLPLFGSILTGGEGSGVFAARYSVKGTGSDPNITVNPLSFLTPGFLRGLFDILDSPKKEEPEAQNQ